VVAERLPQLLESNPHFKAGDYPEALHECFMALDQEMASVEEFMKRIVELHEDSADSIPNNITVDISTLVGFCANNEFGPDSPIRFKATVNQSNIISLVHSNRDPLAALFDGPLVKSFSRNKDGSYDISVTDVYGALERETSAHTQGCTANVVLVDFKTGTIHCANAGDSRAVLARGGQAALLSVDHKPTQPLERRRVLAAGGQIIGKGDNARIEGDLNLSRALGDLRYKVNPEIAPELQIISARPDIRSRRLCQTDKFVVLACDGIWERHTSESCVKSLSEKLLTSDVSTAIEEVFEEIICPSMEAEDCDFTGCDNMTLLVMEFDPAYLATLPETSEETLYPAKPQIFGLPVPELPEPKRKVKKSAQKKKKTKRAKTASD